MRGKTEELRQAVEDWQHRATSNDSGSGGAGVGVGAARLMLSTGFLDAVCPIVDAYELKVHKHAEATVLSSSQAPNSRKPWQYRSFCFKIAGMY